MSALIFKLIKMSSFQNIAAMCAIPELSPLARWQCSIQQYEFMGWVFQLC